MVLVNDGTLDSLGTQLSATTFVIVDLETSGSAPAQGGITEIGAVKVCGGEILSEFQTLVNPGSPIPPFITLLTGINDAMVADAQEFLKPFHLLLSGQANAFLLLTTLLLILGFCAQVQS